MADVHGPLAYCAADHLYYEPPGRLVDCDTLYPLARGEVPSGWRRGTRGLWTTLTPDEVQPVEQGWKIHLSATPRTAEPTLERAAAVLLARRVPFKFLRSLKALLLMSDKNISRGSSGKFVTVYPADDAQLEEILGELLTAVDGLPGPYILSDLRIGRGPVHVRYGAFVEQYGPGEDGLPVPALRRPSGELVPDVRSPVFQIPEWVSPPAVLKPHLAARRAARDDNFPYLVRKALHFSNAGGTYLAEHRETGRAVVLREARPFAGLDGVTDAVERLHREYRALMTLSGLDCVPEVYGLHTVWEHHFLVEEYIEGQTLFDLVINRYPVPGRDTSEEAMSSYARWAQAITDGLARALDAIHERGLCFRDVHPRNIIVRPDNSVALVDFEYATDLGAQDHLRVGARGFAAPAGMAGRDADLYGLWSTWLSLFMPMTEMAEFAPAKAAALEAVARQRFRLTPAEGPRRPVDHTVTETAAAPADDAFDRTHWPAIRDRLIAGIHACATPDREDRLFPADWSVFHTGGHTLAHGAAGVLLALHRAGAAVPPEYSDWLVAAARRVRPEAGRGLYDGLHGVATVLEELGRTEDALETLERARAAGDPVRSGLFGGRAGVALSLCHFAVRTGDSTLLDEAALTAQRLDALLREEAQEGMRMPLNAGLMHGFSGSALLQIRLHRATGEQRYLVAARTALDWELARCVLMPDGTIQAKQGHRHLPYLDEGSAGIALVAREYLTHVDDPRIAAFVASVPPLCASDFVREPGLFRGRAGLLASLSVIGTPDQDGALLTSVRRLSLHAVHKDEGLYFPGSGLLRLSADLATGSAGILLALHIVFGGKGDLGRLLPVS
ncbi:class III lanthionine synthetase LanKC [Streptomyces sp. NPDC001177]